MAYTAWHDFAAAETLTATLMDNIVNNLKALWPVGSYVYLCNSATTAETLVDGVWLECNGVSVLRATYPDLNTKLSGLSYPFGTVDGTHFTLPDAQGRAPVSMASGGHVDVNALGDSDGLAKASRTPKESAHTHTGPSHTHTGPSHTHTVNITSGGESASGPVVQSGTGINVAATPHTHNVNGTSSADGTAATGSGGTGATGSGGASDNAYLVAGVLFIKAVA